jgi:hypothetical protein
MNNMLPHIKLMLLIHLLGDNSMTLTIALSFIPAHQTTTILVGRADAMVSLLDDLLMLAVEEVGLGAEHPGNADEGEEEEEDLHAGLTGVELVVGVDLE